MIPSVSVFMCLCEKLRHFAGLKSPRFHHKYPTVSPPAPVAAGACPCSNKSTAACARAAGRGGRATLTAAPTPPAPSPSPWKTAHQPTRSGPTKTLTPPPTQPAVRRTSPAAKESPRRKKRPDNSGSGRHPPTGHGHGWSAPSSPGCAPFTVARCCESGRLPRVAY